MYGFLGKNREQEFANVREALMEHTIFIHIRQINYTLSDKDAERAIVVLQKLGL